MKITINKDFEISDEGKVLPFLYVTINDQLQKPEDIEDLLTYFGLDYEDLMECYNIPNYFPLTFNTRYNRRSFMENFKKMDENLKKEKLQKGKCPECGELPSKTDGNCLCQKRRLT